MIYREDAWGRLCRTIRWSKAVRAADLAAQVETPIDLLKLFEIGEYAPRPGSTESLEDFAKLVCEALGKNFNKCRAFVEDECEGLWESDSKGLERKLRDIILD